MSTTVELLQPEAPDAPDGRSENNPDRKHRGLWSFLTRSFVLGQLIVAEQFFGAAARAAQSGDELTSGDVDGASSEGSGSGAAALSSGMAGDEAGAASAVNAQQAKILPGSAPQADGAGIPDAGTGGTDISGDAGGGHQGAGGVEAAAAELQDEGVIGDGGSPNGSGGGYGPGAGGDPFDGGIINPVVDLVDTVGETVVEVVGDVGNLVHDVVGTVDVVVGDLLETVDGIVTPTVELVTDTLSVTVDTVASTAMHTVDIAFDAVNGILAPLPVVGEPLTAVTGIVEDVASTTLGTVTPLVSGTVDSLGQTANTIVSDVVPAVGNVVGSGVIPVLQGTVSSVTNPDTLFEGGRYSDFNISLQSVSDPITGAASTIGSAGDDLLDGAGTLLDVPDDTPLSGITNLLGDPLKGGLGDLFA